MHAFSFGILLHTTLQWLMGMKNSSVTFELARNINMAAGRAILRYDIYHIIKCRSNKIKFLYAAIMVNAILTRHIEPPQVRLAIFPLRRLVCRTSNTILRMPSARIRRRVLVTYH